jgi:hypothetical protein
MQGEVVADVGCVVTGSGPVALMKFVGAGRVLVARGCLGSTPGAPFAGAAAFADHAGSSVGKVEVGLVAPAFAVVALRLEVEVGAGEHLGHAGPS